MPDVISVKRLIKIFEDIHQTKSETEACFILGAGASKSSGIRTGSELAKLWYEELQDMYPPNDFKALLKEYGIKAETPEQFYSELYELRYRDEPSLGYDFINKEMDNKQPSYGYTVLAQLLSTTRHNIVISTNFDNLIEYSLYIYTGSQPLICAHESLAKYARPSAKMPVIAKIHRGREFDPNSKREDVKELVSEWVQPLKELLNNRIIICIGYGGNDGSLMGFLEKIDNVKGIFWCVLGNEMPNAKVQKLLDKLGGKIVETEGFDEFMFELQDKLALDLIDQQIEDVAKARATAYRNTVEQIREKNKQAADPDKKKAAENIANKAQKNWFHYVLAARNEPSFEKKESIMQEGLKEFPQEEELFREYSIILMDDKLYDKSEEYILKALAASPRNSRYLNDYAILLDRKGETARANECYLEVLEIQPKDSIVNGNYAHFLDEKMNQREKAEEYFRKSLSLYEGNIYSSINYAAFLLSYKRNDEASPLVDKVIKKFRKSAPSDKHEKRAYLKALILQYLYFDGNNNALYAKITKLINTGVRIHGFNTSKHVKIAFQNSHPNPENVKRIEKKMMN